MYMQGWPGNQNNLGNLQSGPMLMLYSFLLLMTDKERARVSQLDSDSIAYTFRSH